MLFDDAQSYTALKLNCMLSQSVNVLHQSIVSFFAHEHITDINQKMFLTDIELNEYIIIEAIHELFPNSAAGPDCSIFIIDQLCH